MRTIIEPKLSVLKLWGKQRINENTSYRMIKYLLRREEKEGVLLHNTVTGQMVLLTKEEAKKLEDLPARPSESLFGLIENHFLVPENFDEYKSVNQLRKILETRKTSTFINRYTILPTSFCNAHCFYCYESDYPRMNMSVETADKIVNFICSHCQDKHVTLRWFGGEPLVGIQRIDQISRGLKERGLSFSASMVTNGYLFDESIVKRSVELWKLKHVQITLDGTEDVYNKVKAFASATDNPYKRVLNNIDLLSAYKINVGIRLNLDFYNWDNLQILIEELGQRYSGNQYVRVYANMLFNNAGFEPVHHTQEDIVKLMRMTDSIMARLQEYGLYNDGRKIPSLRYGQCMADNPNALLFQPDGSFCRCEHESAAERYGSLDQGVVDEEKLLSWKETVERSDYCPECDLYPSCYLLRRCMNGESKCIEPFRQRARVLDWDYLHMIYQRKMEVVENEGV